MIDFFYKLKIIDFCRPIFKYIEYFESIYYNTLMNSPDKGQWQG